MTLVGFFLGLVVGWLAAGLYTLVVIAWATRSDRTVHRVDVWAAGDTTARLNQLHRVVYGRPRPNGRAN